MNKTPFCIAVDWGTSRFRAYLVSQDGDILEQVSSHDGMARVEAGAFAETLFQQCKPWLDAYDNIPVLMAGMVGSRNGWLEVPYARCPAGSQELALGTKKVETPADFETFIVPGLETHDGQYMDVMRGEETQIIGSGMTDGTVILPGTHSKWAQVENGQILSFSSFMTGEVFGLFKNHSILRLLAKSDATEVDPQKTDAAFVKGLDAAHLPGGLLNAAFMARTGVLAGTLNGEDVDPFLSGLLVGTEILSARPLMTSHQNLLVIADGILAHCYALALKHQGYIAEIISPETAFVTGLLTIFKAKRKPGHEHEKSGTV
ncbi:2-dehydro-3-deoxygalactonokinase [uncultured Cohaesibacter sp.]|uniref:2-dehydro-3-deoxygalactonokinase n=1 Tax=uncultured Cohaesibacter sp. TaxID=1002546 RepID=UPI0029316D72|nr:2-dehydro-3-deoxygalactonokinase [uncultured Cohaesibacter sp.]